MKREHLICEIIAMRCYLQVRRCVICCVH